MWPLYLGVVTPFGIIYTFNVIMFFLIISSVLCQGKLATKEKRKDKYFKKMIVIFVLAIMFGIGWIFGVLGSSGLPEFISRPFQYTFIIMVGFQGFFVFLLHPCRSIEAREEWKKWFYYTTCRVGAYKEKLLKSKQSRADNSSTATRKTNPRALSRYGRTPSSTLDSRSRRSSEASIADGLGNISSFDFPGSRRSSRSSLVDSLGRTSRLDLPGSTSEISPHKGSLCLDTTLNLSNRQSSQSSISNSLVINNPGNTLERTRRKGSLGLDAISEENEHEFHPEEIVQPNKKKQIRQIFMFENDGDKPLTFSGRNGSEDNLICFSPEPLTPTHDDESDGETATWRTFEYDDDLQTGATTIFINYENHVEDQ